MKKLSIEEKAKAYDEALEKARNILDSTDDNYVCTYLTKEDIKGMYSRFFPELTESEDEKIRKMLIKFFGNSAFSDSYTYGISDKDIVAWLEKQGTSKKDATREKVAEYLKNLILDQSQRGFPMLNYEGRIEEEVDFIINIAKKELKKDEQKSADKVKFKVGDWVVSPNGVYWHIDRIENNRYEVTSDTGKCADWPLDTDLYHLWTIADAKKGDVIACGKCILIFDQLSESNNEQVLMDICHCTSKGFYWQDTKDRDVWALDGFKPATKEQRDTLFAKMQEAGFEWDTEKKELKKIEQEPIDCNEEYYNEELKNALFTSLRDAREQYLREKNAAWSDEDENMIRGLIAICDEWVVRHSCYPVENCDIEKLKNWLKAFKQRIKL